MALTIEQQHTPLGEGKWMVRDVVAHIWRWDEHFWAHAIRPLIEGQPLTYRHIYFNAFNEAAKNECRELAWDDVCRQSVAARRRLADAIRAVPEDAYEREYRDADGHPFTLAAYLADFAEHDDHHRRQIEAALGR